MHSTENPISWYEITKDIIIPILSIVTTLIIGIIIAIIIKRREEKGKSKQLLVDTYMEYLNRRIKRYSYDFDSNMYDMYNDIYMNYGDYYENHANSHLATDSVKVRRDRFLEKVEKYDNTDINWTFYAIKFSLLLGRTKYNKEALVLEKKISKVINSEQAIMDFLLKLKEEIKEDKKISKYINASDKSKIEYGLDMIESHINKRYRNHQFSLFKSYDEKIADLISEY